MGLYIKIHLTVFVLCWLPINVHANDIAKCAVTFNMLARSMESIDGVTTDTVKLRKGSVALGRALRETYSDDVVIMMLEDEVLNLRRHTDGEALMNDLVANFDFCSKLLSRG